VAFVSTPGAADANSLTSVEYADAYFAERANATWAALSLADKQSALILGTDYLVATYEGTWAGERASGTQALPWPRREVYSDGYALPSDTIPGRLQMATAEAALRSRSGALIEDQGQRVIREKVDVLETEYAETSDPTKRYPMVSALVAPLLRISVGGGGFVAARLVRV